MKTLKLKAELSNLRTFREFVCRYLDTHHLDEERYSDIELAIEELLANVICYSYPDSEGDLEVQCSERKNVFSVVLVDEGEPFDPVAVPPPDLNAPLEERSKGGMGIFLVKNLVDDLKYQRKKNKNILTVTIKK